MINLSKSIDGTTLAGMFAAGEVVLENNVEGVNSLNVFPVPDGDTGTNMLLTLRAVSTEIKKAPTQSLGKMAQVISRSALLGARGNSGVILSQFLRGLTKQFDGMDKANAACLARAFYQGALAAYSSVGNPVEGTILTVMRVTGQSMTETQDLENMNVIELLEKGLKRCKKAVLETQDQLPILKSAGVVDAGGQGFELIVRGFVAYLKGDDPDEIVLDWAAPDKMIRKEFFIDTQDQMFGYCTQIMVSGSSLEPDSIRSVLMNISESTVVVGDENLVKIHVHTSDPGPVLSLGASLGTLRDVKIESMDEQHEEFQIHQSYQLEVVPLGVVTVGWGDGIENLFTNLGARSVIKGGQTMNPSCQDFLDAATNARSEILILLPNNRNVVSTAHQAAELSEIPITVIETTTIQQGVAAILSFNEHQDLDSNVKAMSRTASDIRSGEVVTAVRDAVLDGKAIKAGEIIGRIEEEVVCFGNSPREVLQTMITNICLEEGSLITLYWGGDITADDVEETVKELINFFPSVEIETVYGGQPYYHYLVSFE